MADTNDTAAATAASGGSDQQQPTRKRFQKRTLSAEYLQEDYEQNTLGATAGFFCAIWAGWLMGEHFSSTFTTFDYPNLDKDGQYHFGGKDIALVVLITSKLLFVRAGLFRYVLRPLLRCLGVQSFERQQGMAEHVYTGLVYLASAISAAYFVGWPRLDSLGLESLWSGASLDEGVSTEFKVFVLGQCALRLAELVAVFIEDENRPGYYRRIAIHYLVAGVLACAGLLGQAKFAGLVVLAIDLPTVIAAVSGVSSALSACLHQVMNVVAGGIAALSTLVVLPSLVYVSVRCGSLADTRVSAQCWALMGSMTALCVLQGVQTKNLWQGATTSAHAPDMSKKTL